MLSPRVVRVMPDSRKLRPQLLPENAVLHFMSSPHALANKPYAVRNHALQDFKTGFADHNLFPVNQRQHGVGRRFGKLDQVAVYNQGIAVQPGQFDHFYSLPRVLLIGGLRERFKWNG